MSASRENHIVCVGAVYIDTILTVPHFPIEDEKLRAKSITRRRGGNTANSLEVLSQLLAHDRTSMQPPAVTNLHLLAVLPNQQSPASHFISESLPAVNVSGLSLFREDHQDAASSYIIQSEANRSRTIVSINELAEMQASEFTTQIRNAAADWNNAWCHFEGRIPDVTHACVKFLCNEFPHFRLSVECEKPERREMAEVAKHADVVFYSKLWAQKNGYQDAESFLQAQISDKRDGTLLCCTWGSEGAVAVKKGECDEATWARVKAWQQTEESGEPTRVIDTIGAGDTFIAGMLFAVNNHEEWALQQKLEFANELAGRKVLQEGFGGLGAKMW